MIVPGVVVVIPQALRAWLEGPEHKGKCMACRVAPCGFVRLQLYERENHPLDGQPLHRRETGLLEAICIHGVGHPIEESVKQLDASGPKGSRGTWGMHGCDGCCMRKQ